MGPGNRPDPIYIYTSTSVDKDRSNSQDFQNPQHPIPPGTKSKQTNKQTKPTVHFFLLRHRAVSKSHRSLFPLPVVVHWHETVLRKALASPEKKVKNLPLAQGPPSNPARLRVEVQSPLRRSRKFEKPTTLLSQTAGKYGHSQIDIKISKGRPRERMGRKSSICWMECLLPGSPEMGSCC